MVQEKAQFQGEAMNTVVSIEESSREVSFSYKQEVIKTGINSKWFFVGQ